MMTKYRCTSITGERFAFGDWEVHYRLSRDAGEREAGSGWIRNRATKRLRRFAITRGKLRWWDEHHGLQLIGKTGLTTYDPIRNTKPVEPILLDILTNAFHAEIE